jgi:hypothetical protein
MRLGPPGISLREGELFDFPVQCPRRYAERCRGLCLVAVGLTQSLLDEVFLTLFDVPDCFCPNFLAMPGGIVLQVHREIVQRDVIAVRNHHRTFNNASKLTNISRPRIIQEEGLGGTADFFLTACETGYRLGRQNWLRVR